MKLDGVAILVLDKKIMSWMSFWNWNQPDRVEGHFLISSQNVVTIISTHNIDYFQDEDNDHEGDENWFPVSKDDQNTSRKAPQQQYQVWVDSIWDEEIWPSVVNFWLRDGNSTKILYQFLKFSFNQWTWMDRKGFLLHPVCWHQVAFQQWQPVWWSWREQAKCRASQTVDQSWQNWT